MSEQNESPQKEDALSKGKRLLIEGEERTRVTFFVPCTGPGETYAVEDVIAYLGELRQKNLVEGFTHSSRVETAFYGYW